MKLQPRSLKTGQWVRRPSSDGPLIRDENEQTVLRRSARVGVGDRQLARVIDDPLLLRAMRRERDDFLAELGEESASHSARVLVDSIVATKLRRDTMLGVVVQLGPKVINRGRREAYKIVAQLDQVERLLADLLQQFQDMKLDRDLERRIQALEDDRA